MKFRVTSCVSVFLFVGLSLSASAGVSHRLPSPSGKTNLIPGPETALPGPVSRHPDIIPGVVTLNGSGVFYAGLGLGLDHVKTNNKITTSTAQFDESDSSASPVLGIGWWRRKPLQARYGHQVFYGAQLLYQPISPSTETKTTGDVSLLNSNYLGALLQQTYKISPNGEVEMLGNIGFQLAQRVFGILGGGVAMFPNVEYSVILPGLPTQNMSKSMLGGVGRAGVFYQFSSNLSLNASYLFTKTSAENFNLGGVPYNIDLSNHQFLFMLNWFFSKNDKPVRQASLNRISKTVLKD